MMRNEPANLINFVVGATGFTAALKPRTVNFYETPEWLGLTAILGVTLLVISIINGSIPMRRKIKNREKDNDDT